MKKHIKKLFLQILFFIAFRISADELTLKNNTIFVGEIVSESEQVVKFRWKEKFYFIPKYDIEKIDRKKNGNHKSFEIIVVDMKDGSSLRGIQVESNQNILTLSNDLGLIKIDPARVLKKSKEPIEDFTPDHRYLSQKNILSSDQIYLTGNIGNIAGGLPFNSLAGFRIGYDPSIFALNDRFRLGFSIDGKAGNSDDSRSSQLYVGTFHSYLKIQSKLNNTFVLFSEIGPSFNATSYRDSAQKTGGFNLGLGIGIGLQYFVTNDSGIQLALRENYIPEPSIKIFISQVDLGYFHIL